MFKERFNALAMDKMHIHGIYILDVIFVTSSFCYDAKSIWVTCLVFYYLPPTVYFGIFRLEMANKLQEIPDSHTLQWS